MQHTAQQEDFGVTGHPTGQPFMLQHVQQHLREHIRAKHWLHLDGFLQKAGASQPISDQLQIDLPVLTVAMGGAEVPMNSRAACRAATRPKGPSCRAVVQVPANWSPCSRGFHNLSAPDVNTVA